MRSSLRPILITGGAGFIGSEFVRQLASTGNKLIVVDKLSYAGDMARLKPVISKIKFFRVDICDKKRITNIFRKYKPGMIVHFAADTHVDRSILDVEPFIKTNVIGTQTLIDVARLTDVKRFVHISTDEVYGASKSGFFTEESPLQPNNPYSATKTAAELLVRAAIKTYQFPAIIVRPANNYGPWQYPEKFIPVIILKALNGEKIPVYGKGEQIREWLYVGDCARAIATILRKGKIGEAYNIGSDYESKNLQTAKTILKMLGKPESQIEFVQDRPGHDFRYSVDCRKLKKLGWRAKINFINGLENTLKFYITK